MSKLKRGLSFVLCLVMVLSLLTGIPIVPNTELDTGVETEAYAKDSNTNAGTSEWVTLWHTTPLFLNASASKLSTLSTLLTVGNQITFRSLIPITMGGDTMRFTISNQYGDKSLLIGEITIAKGGGSDVGCWADGTASIFIKGTSNSGSTKSFSSAFSEAIAAGKASVGTDGEGTTCIYIHAGQTVTTDPIDVSSLNLEAMDNISFSTYLCNLKSFSGGITGGLIGARTSYLRIADTSFNCNHTEQFDLDYGTIHDAELTSSDDTGSYNVIPFITGIEVKRNTIKGVDDVNNAYTTVIFGDSTVANDIPIYLAKRLKARDIDGVAVTYASTKGNELLLNGQSNSPDDGETSSDCSGPPMGKSGLAIMQDIVNLPGVKKVIVKEGINDILHPYCDDLDANYAHKTTAAEIIAGYKQLIKIAHDAGVEIYFYELTPWAGTDGSSGVSYTRDSQLYWAVDRFSDAQKIAFATEAENIRTAVNAWLKQYGKKYDNYLKLGRNTNSDGATAISVGNNNYGATSGRQACDEIYARTPANINVSGNFDTFGFISLSDMYYPNTSFLNLSYTTDGIHFTSTGQAKVASLTPTTIFYKENDDYETGTGAEEIIENIFLSTTSVTNGNSYFIVNTNGILNTGKSYTVYDNAADYNQSVSGYAVSNSGQTSSATEGVYFFDGYGVIDSCYNLDGNGIAEMSTIGELPVTVQVGTSKNPYIIGNSKNASAKWSLTGTSGNFLWSNILNGTTYHLAWYYSGVTLVDVVYPTSPKSGDVNITGNNAGWYAFNTVEEKKDDSGNKTGMVDIYYVGSTDLSTPKNLVFFNKNMNKDWQEVQTGTNIWGKPKYEWQLVTTSTNYGPQFATSVRKNGSYLDNHYDNYNLALFDSNGYQVRATLDITGSGIDTSSADNSLFYRKAANSTVPLQFKLTSQVLDNTGSPTGSVYTDSPANNDARGPYSFYTFGDNQKIFWYSSDTSVATVSQSSVSGNYTTGGGTITFTGKSGSTDIVANFLWTEDDGRDYVFDNKSGSYYSTSEKNSLSTSTKKVENNYNWVEIGTDKNGNGQWVYTNYHWLASENTVTNVLSYGADILLGSEDNDSFVFYNDPSETDLALIAQHISDPSGLTLPGTGWTWTSSNTSVATVSDIVDDYAQLNLVGYGTATITATRVDSSGNPVKDLDNKNITSSITVEKVKVTFTGQMKLGSSVITTHKLKTYAGNNTATLTTAYTSSLAGYSLPAGGTWTWTSSNPSAVTVSGSGATATITGGSANADSTVTATYTYKGVDYCTCSATITNVASVNFTSAIKNSGGTVITSCTLDKYQNQTSANLTAVKTGPSGYNLSDYTDGHWEWSSDNTDLVTVTKTDDGSNLNQSVARIACNKAKNGTATVTAKFISDSKGKITETSVSVSVINVDYTGQMKLGGNVITAHTLKTFAGSGKNTATLTAAYTSSPTGYSLPSGGTWAWSSDNTSAVTVSGSGTTATITGGSTSGSAKVKATYTYNSKVYCTCEATITNVASVTFTSVIKNSSGTEITSCTLDKYTSANTAVLTAAQKSANPNGYNLSDYTDAHWEWSSDNTNVVTVTNNNSDTTTITGTSTDGTATVTAKYISTSKGIITEASVNVTVINVKFTGQMKRGSDVITTYKLKTYAGKNTTTLTAVPTSSPAGYSLPSGGTWAWSSDNTSAVTVSGSGTTATITGGSTSGSAKVKATYTYNSKVYCTCEATITNVATATINAKFYNDANTIISSYILDKYSGLTSSIIEIRRTSSDPNSCHFYDYSGGHWEWSSSDSGIVSVAKNDSTTLDKSFATITGGATNGTATITATFYSSSGDKVFEKSITVTNRAVYTLDLVPKGAETASDLTFSDPDYLNFNGPTNTDKLILTPVLKCGDAVVVENPSGTFTWGEDITPSGFSYTTDPTTGVATISFTGGSITKTTLTLTFSNAEKDIGTVTPLSTTFALKTSKAGGVTSNLVITYGVPVDITYTGYALIGLSTEEPSVELAIGRTTSNECTKKEIDINGFKVKLTSRTTSTSSDPNSINHLLFTPTGIASGSTTIYYSIRISSNSVTGYKYNKISVVPASAVYYEDSNSDITYVNGSGGSTGAWTTTGEEKVITPTSKSLTEQIYGGNASDAYKNSYDYSLDSAHKVTVSKANNPNPKYGEAGASWPYAQFTFTGTGFDVISRTGNDCGMVSVEIYEGSSVADDESNLYDIYAVDTYRGYSLTTNSELPYIKYTWIYQSDNTWHIKYYSGANETGDGGQAVSAIGTDTAKPEKPKVGDTFSVYEKNYVWTPDDTDNANYQIPVIQIKDLTKGTYTVRIVPTYSSKFDQTTAKTGYSFYLDAIRIYGITDGSDPALTASKQGYPKYLNLKEYLLSSSAFKNGETSMDGIALFDGLSSEDATVLDYKDYGANNEIYLQPNQGLTFTLKTSATPKKVQIGMKALKGSDIITDTESESDGAKVELNGTITPITSVSNLYYDISDLTASTTITVVNKGTVPVSLTTLKVNFDKASKYVKSLSVTKKDVTVAKTAVRMMMLASAPVAPAPFEPTVSVSAPDKVTVGDTVTVKVTTSDDVAYITVNGNKVETNKDFVWTYSVKADEVGTMSFSVKAYNADGKAADDVKSASVTVEPKPFVPTVSVSAPDKVTVGDTVTVKVTTSDDVAYITVNGNKVETNKDFVWTYSVKADEVGTMSFSVKAYNADGKAADDVKSASVTVEPKPFVPTVSVSAPDKVTVGDTVTVKVTTSDDVAYITVNGNKVETNKDFVWTYSVKADEVGTMSFSVKAYNADGKAADDVKSASVTVEPKPFVPTVSVSAPDKVTVGDTVTVKVTTSDDVAYITVNGVKVTANENYVWTYETTADEAGTMSFTVKAYNADGKAADDTQTASVTVEKASVITTVVNAVVNFFKKLFGIK